MSVREIVERAGVRLPSKSKTPDTVVARDLSMDIKKKGETSIFVRTSPGRYTLRALATVSAPVTQDAARPLAATSPAAAPTSMSALPQRKPAVAAPTVAGSTGRARTENEASSPTSGGGFAG